MNRTPEICKEEFAKNWNTRLELFAELLGFAGKYSAESLVAGLREEILEDFAEYVRGLAGAESDDDITSSDGTPPGFGLAEVKILSDYFKTHSGRKA